MRLLCAFCRWLEAGFMKAWFLPGWFRDLAAYVAFPTSSFRRRPEPSGVAASYLPVCFRDLAAYAAGVSNACRRPSHFLFAGPRLRVAHANGEAGPEGGGPLGPE